MDDHRAGDHGVGQGFGDLGFSAAGDGAGFVAESAFGVGADEAPALALGGFDHFDFVAGGEDVGAVWLELEGLWAGGVFPGDGLLVEVDVGVLGDVADVGVGGVDAIALGLEVHEVAVALDDAFEGVGAGAEGFEVGEGEVFAEVEGRVGDGAAGVFFLAVAVEVGGVGDLGFDLFFAVAVVVVGDHGDDGAAGIAGGDFEGGAVVVEFVVFFPAHAVGALAVGGLGDVREADVFFGEPDEVGGEDDGAGVAGPAIDVEAGVIFREEGIAGVAEDGFYEVEVRDEVTGGEEADFHGFLGRDAGDFGGDDGTEEE